MITVGSAAANKGEKGQGFIDVGGLAVHAEIRIPVLIVNGRESGPTLWLNGAVHGDELNGFLAMRRVAAATDPRTLKGALICTPLANPLATQWRDKVSPYDHLDLDMQFPGDPAGLMSQRVADRLFREIKVKAQFLINFHTVGTPFSAISYALYKRVPGVKEDIFAATEGMARAFGLKYHCRVDLASARGELPGNQAGALDVNCQLQGIPAFMAEVGCGGRFEEEKIAAAERGIRNVMKHLGMIAGEPERPEKQIVITRRKFIYANQAGFLIPEVGPGAILSPGQRIGRIVDFFSDVETVEAQEEVFIIHVRVHPTVHTGDRLAFLGLEWEPF